MSYKTEQDQPTLDEIVADIRRDDVGEVTAKQAAQRVWARMREESGASSVAAIPEKIRGCADFQALVPAYLNKELSNARSMLLEDHVHGCVACRHVLEEARRGAKGAARQVETGARGKPRWALAGAFAAGLVIVALGSLVEGGRLIRLVRSSEIRASVQTVDGVLYEVAARGAAALRAGGEIRESQEVRTAKASAAVVRLADGSAIEMDERTALWVTKGWRDTTIHLQRGNIIVRAAPQHHGRLYVATRDCLVSVKGTIFGVDAGMKGSRVSVIEGVVEVQQGREKRYLHAGEQTATETSLAPEPVSHAVGWSRNSGEYLALLGEFAALHKQFEALPGPAPRYDSTLLKLVPEDTIFYAAIPNIGSTLDEAGRLLQERIQQSEVLQAWWNHQQASGEAHKQSELLDRIRAFSEYLGDEVVIAVPAGTHSPLILAEVRRPDFRTFLEAQLREMQGDKKEFKASIVDNPFAAPPVVGTDTALIFQRNNVVALATDIRQLQKAAALIGNGAPGGFVSTPFFAAIRQAYQSGAGLLICADMEQILGHSVNQKEKSNKDLDFVRDERLGLADMRYLIMESKDVSGRTQNRATLTFAQNRRGVAAWLASPSPMGTLDFVSPAAGFALSAVVEDPRQIVQEFIDLVGSRDAGLKNDLAQFESESGINVSEDLAGALGGEVTVALDGPILPTPSWKVAVEVNDPARLQGTIEKLVALRNQHAGANAGTLRLAQEASGGSTYYTLQIGQQASAPGMPTEIHYTFADGYLLAAANRALLLSSMESRKTGYTLARASEFTKLLPRDNFTNCSALAYQNLAAVLGSAADVVKASPLLTPAQRQAIDSLQQNSGPSLTCAYGEPQDIVIANSGNLFGLGFDSLLGIKGAGLFDLLPAIEGAAKSTPKS